MKLTEEEQAEIVQSLIDKNQYELVQRFFDSQVEIEKPICTGVDLKSWIITAHDSLRVESKIPYKVVDFIINSALKEVN